MIDGREQLNIRQSQWRRSGIRGAFCKRRGIISIEDRSQARNTAGRKVDNGVPSDQPNARCAGGLSESTDSHIRIVSQNAI
jgi:hypothetical protein